MRTEKARTEQAVIESIRNGSLSFPPAVLTPLDLPLDPRSRQRYDGMLLVDWNGETARYVFEHKSTSSPKDFRSAILQAKAASADTGLRPMVLLPYLAEPAMSELEAQGVSGLDLCGNGVLVGPNFRIWRSGAPNRYKDTRPIRNPYSGDSSIFSRCFLLRREFKSLGELQSFARERTLGLETMQETQLSLATASKVVTALEDELVVARQANSITLIDARRLLELLQRGARKRERDNLIGRTPLDIRTLWSRLARRESQQLRSVATGLASSTHYGLLSGIEKLSLYVDDLERAAEILEITPGRAFANIELLEERKNDVYFDARPDGAASWASPIQTWLELTLGGPREQDAAREMERRIIAGDVEESL